ncbi:hypothetical protein [Azospirillum soli]|uniref:hypothetical protein n=1 Tax=Azospirillum soli TaxID=1304799 RepID=UPI001AE17401|nr:hypothetical protein [Azospirillum soli]MBP2316924.1 hypothetical protein [Azospirillum soli]
MAIFKTIVYPDNEQRALRVYELSNDCIGLFQKIATQKEQVERALADVVAASTATYGKVAAAPLPKSLTTLDESWQAQAPLFAGTLLVRKSVQFGLEIAAKSWAVQQGRIAGSVVGGLIQLPRWLVLSEFRAPNKTISGRSASR